jgi:hypothetical protein
MERKRILKWVLVIVVALVLAGAVGLALAQEPEGNDDVLPQGEVGAAAALNDVIPIQGRLTDNHGNPINGTRTVVLTLYDASSGGNVLCTDTDNVQAVNGLFNFSMDYCTAADLNGRAVWLGIKVGGDAEMTPRQEIFAVPYAWGLRPGAIISGSLSSAIVHIENWYSTGRGLCAYAMSETGVNYGIVGASRSPDGYGGWFYNEEGGTGLQAHSNGAGLNGPAVVAEATGSSGIALHAEATSTDAAVVIENKGTGPLLKGFGPGGGEDEIRINNNGSIETKADSYIFIPGTQIIKNLNSDSTRWDVQANGAVRIWRGATAGTKTVYLSIVMPGVLYGQPVDVESITIYYRCQDGTKNYITGTYLNKATDADSWATLVSDTTDRKSNTATNYTMAVNNVLSASQGFLGLFFYLTFADDVNYIQLGGVRVQLGHHHLY